MLLCETFTPFDSWVWQNQVLEKRGAASFCPPHPPPASVPLLPHPWVSISASFLPIWSPLVFPLHPTSLKIPVLLSQPVRICKAFWFCSAADLSSPGSFWPEALEIRMQKGQRKKRQEVWRGCFSSFLVVNLHVRKTTGTVGPQRRSYWSLSCRGQGITKLWRHRRHWRTGDATEAFLVHATLYHVPNPWSLNSCFQSCYLALPMCTKLMFKTPLRTRCLVCVHVCVPPCACRCPRADGTKRGLSLQPGRNLPQAPRATSSPWKL